MPPNENSAIGPIYYVNDHGEWQELGDIEDAPIGNDPPDGIFGLHFDPNETMILDLDDRKAKRILLALLGWRAKGPMRYKMHERALKRYETAKRLQEA